MCFAMAYTYVVLMATAANWIHVHVPFQHSERGGYHNNITYCKSVSYLYAEMHGRWFFWMHPVFYHSDVTISAVVSIIFSAVCCVHIAEKHQSSLSLAFVKGIHRWPVTRKMLPFDDVNVNRYNSGPVIIWNTNSVVTVPADDAVTHRWCSNRLWITITHRDRFAAKFFWKHLIHYSYLFFHSMTQALTIVSFCGKHRYEEIKTYGCSNGCTVSKIPHNSGCLHIVIVRDYSIKNPLDFFCSKYGYGMYTADVWSQ